MKILEEFAVCFGLCVSVRWLYALFISGKCHDIYKELWGTNLSAWKDRSIQSPAPEIQSTKKSCQCDFSVDSKIQIVTLLVPKSPVQWAIRHSTQAPISMWWTSFPRAKQPMQNTKIGTVQIGLSPCLPAWAQRNINVSKKHCTYNIFLMYVRIHTIHICVY